ncbi:hypothetical protein PYCC9005_005927 [Savitreella phatthalungensis]
MAPSERTWSRPGTPAKRPDASSHKHTASYSWPDNCPDLVQHLAHRFSKIVDGPYTFEQLRTLEPLKLFVDELKTCNELFLVFAILYCKLQYAAKAAHDDRSVDGSRGFACEIAAMRILRTYDADKLLASLTNDFRAVPLPPDSSPEEVDNTPSSQLNSNVVERTPLLSINTRTRPEIYSGERVGDRDSLTALEVAIVADAKHFIASQTCQDIVSQIWHGDIIFWSRITSSETKRAQYYDTRKAQQAHFWNFARLRVPKYNYCIESFNFLVLLLLYLFVVWDREYRYLGAVEVVLGLLFLGFGYNEWDQFREAGQSAFYFAQFFNYIDISIAAVAVVWIILRCIGIARADVDLVARSYDVLSLAGVLLVPRLFSFLSLSPWFGTLFPCLKRLAADFCKFVVLVFAMYTGFLVTFAILGREHYGVGEIAWLLVRIFYGSSYLGFDIQSNIHPVLGPPLMLIFVTFSQMLLTTALISVLSNSFAQVMDNAREEYLFLFTTTCLEASKSDHTVRLMPPFNLLSLVLVRPLRLILPSNHPTMRKLKVAILKTTHAPFVLCLSLYERSWFAPDASDARRRREAQAAVERGLRRAGANGVHFRKRMSYLLDVTPNPGTASTGGDQPADAGLLSPSTARFSRGSSLVRAHTANEAPATTNHRRQSSDVESALDENEADGLDTGVMLCETDSKTAPPDEALKQRLDDLQKEVAELKTMLKEALAATQKI